MIYDCDIIKNQYDIETLEKNIEHLNEKTVLHTQKLTAEFCIKYILDLNIEGGSEDTYLFDKTHILRTQPHITEKEFDDAYKLYYL